MRFKRLALLYTQKCTAECDICCFSCGPKRAEKMSLSDAISYVEQVTDIPSISMVGVSGGEPFLYYPEILEIAKTANKQGLASSCVTNGYWATTKDIALRKLEGLQNFGLSLINVSLDTYHQQYVPLDNISNILLAADELGLEKTLACTITRASSRLYEMITPLGNDICNTTLIELPCLPIGRAIEKIPLPDFLVDTSMLSLPCFDLNDLAIDPQGNAYPCCSQGGMTSVLCIGSAKKESLIDLEHHFRGNMICRLLASHGPGWFVKAIENAGLGHKLNQSYTGICHLCYHILSIPEMITVVQGVADMEGKAIIQRALDSIRQAQNVVSLGEQL